MRLIESTGLSYQHEKRTLSHLASQTAKPSRRKARYVASKNIQYRGTARMINWINNSSRYSLQVCNDFHSYESQHLGSDSTIQCKQDQNRFRGYVSEVRRKASTVPPGFQLLPRSTLGPYANRKIWRLLLIKPSSNRHRLLSPQRPRHRKNTMMPPVLHQRQFLLPSQHFL